jgi:hypothetical protein
MGSRWARQALERNEDPRSIWERWEAELEEWRPLADQYRLYR